MGVETLLYAYLGICASMIVFNCVCAVVFRSQDRELQKRSARLEKCIAEQIRRIEAGGAVEASHRELLKKKLRRTSHLMTFDEALDRLSGREPEAVGRYLEAITPVFSSLAVKNKYHSAMKKAHFAYVLRKYRILEGKPLDTILLMLERLLRENSIYCRENALQAIYSTGDCGCVLRALLTVDENSIFYHPKLLTDGLVSFAGDQRELARVLWQSFDRFSVRMRVVILDYIRFSGAADMRQELLALLADGQQDDEIRFSCIRYFGKYPCGEALPLLLSFAGHPEGSRWEYGAIAASTLSAYPGERTVEVLKKALNSPDWYIRFNAAKSLERFHLTYRELGDVLDGEDRYAREILQYRLDVRNYQESQETLQV